MRGRKKKKDPSQEEVIADALDLRNKLEELATAQPDGNYIRPIVLLSGAAKTGGK